jgi:hypothetical protein
VTITIFVFCHSLLPQEFSFERKIAPFPVLDQNGQPYELPFTGGMNRPVQQFIDIDGDDDPDLFVQEDEANRLILFRNIGTPTDIHLQWETDQFENLEVGAWFKFADVDNDGDFDLFAEKPVGIIQYLRNDGSATEPDFIKVVDSLKDNTESPILVEGFSVPEWADINGDNNLDLFIGNIQDGSITYYRHIDFDVNNIPHFEFVTDRFQGLQIITGGGKERTQLTKEIDTALHGANSMTFIDIDNDQDYDLFWGDFFSGGLIYLQNFGTSQEPLFDINTIVENYPLNDPVWTGGFNVPRFVDADADGDYDMFVGVLGGFVSTILDKAENLYFYENIGSPAQPLFTLKTKQLIKSLDIGQNTISTLVDIDNDSDLDLFLANEIDLKSPGHSNSRLHFFENQGSSANPSFNLIDTHYLNYDRPIFDANYAPAFVDIDNDVDKDLFLGKWDGKLTFYRNDGSASSPDFELIDENYAAIDVGMNSTPAFVDIDDDGDFDLFIGEQSQNVAFGRINFYCNNGTVTNPAFDLVTTNYFDIDLGAGEILYPSFADIDNDKDWDLFIGTRTLGIVMYRNTGTSQSADFVLDSSFQLLPRQLRTSPNFVDIDNDGDLDIFSGSRGGGVIFYENLKIPTKIEPSFPTNADLPASIHLLGNYPNPFNPITSIVYSIPQSGFVELKIYDTLGREIQALVSDFRQAGSYSFDFDASNLSNGVYFYQLKVGNRLSETKKMLYLK